MQQVLDYIRSSSATYSRAAIDQQLRVAGYDEATIDHAWQQVATAPAAMPAGQAFGVAVATRTTARRQDPMLILAIVTIAVIAVAGFFLQQSRSQQVERIPASDIERTEVLDEISEDTGMSTSELSDAVDVQSGGIDTSDLPDGWTRDKSGMYADAATFHNVSVASVPSEGLDAKQAAQATVGIYDDLESARVVQRPKAVTINGRDAWQIKMETQVSGLDVSQVQWMVETGDDITAITATYVASSDQDEIDETFEVVELVQLTD